MWFTVFLVWIAVQNASEGLLIILNMTDVRFETIRICEEEQNILAK